MNTIRTQGKATPQPIWRSTWMSLLTRISLIRCSKLNLISRLLSNSKTLRIKIRTCFSIPVQWVMSRVVQLTQDYTVVVLRRKNHRVKRIMLLYLRQKNNTSHLTSSLKRSTSICLMKLPKRNTSPRMKQSKKSNSKKLCKHTVRISWAQVIRSLKRF